MGRLAMITGTSFALSLVFTRVLISLLNKWGMQQIIRKDGPQSHLKKSKTPTMGGVGFFLATTIALAAFGEMSDRRVKVVLVVSAICFLLGLADDIAKFTGKSTEGIKARYKIVIEIVLALLLARFMFEYNTYNTMYDLIMAPKFISEMGINAGIFFVPLVLFAFIGTLNGVNFTDGVDGLLGNSYIIAIGAFAIFIYKGDRALLPLFVAIAGSVAAFLWFNSHPAKIFMGDAGSLYLGGLIGAVAVVSRAELFLMIVGFVFAAEVMSVIIQVTSFKLTGKRVFRMSPIHHHFELGGWSETQVTARFAIVTAICSLIGIYLFVV